MMQNKWFQACLGCGKSIPVHKHALFCEHCMETENYKEEQRALFENSVDWYKDIEDSCRDYEVEDEQN